jgi:hypothetical protein
MKNNLFKSIIGSLVVSPILLLLMGCVSNGLSVPPTPLATDSRALTDYVAESVLVSLNTHNFDLWSKLLEPNQTYPPKTSFDSMCDNYKKLFGNYLSKKFANSFDAGDSIFGFSYIAQFSNAPNGVEVDGSIKTINGVTFLHGFSGLVAYTSPTIK